MQEAHKSLKYEAFERLQNALNASRSYFRDLHHQAYEMMGDPNKIGRTRRFLAAKIDSALGFLSDPKSMATIALVDAFTQSAQTITDGLQNLSQYVSAPVVPIPNTLDLSQTFTAHTEYVSESVAMAVTDTIATKINQVERIVDGSFVGPHLPAVQSLLTDFNANTITKERAIQALLFEKGVLFSAEHKQYGLRLDDISSIRNRFNHETATHGINPVLVFRQAATSLIQPQTSLIQTTYEPVPVIY